MWVERNLHEVIIGYNAKWKQNVHFWKKITQIFVAIPFIRIINQLKYKAAERGIKIELIPNNILLNSVF
ncbi:MAG: hypothetical protein ACTSSN_04035 [Candidatus Heimdallarchaeaceae archaeon]